MALTQAAETVTVDSLATLTRLADGRASLALTAPRAQALELASAGSGVVALPLGRTTDAETIRGLIDPTYPSPAGRPRASPRAGAPRAATPPPRSRSPSSPSCCRRR